MRLGNVSVFVENVPQTVDFYGRVFGLSLLYMHPSQEYAELATGDTLLSFIGEKMLSGLKLIGGAEYRKNRPSEQPIGSQIALISDDLQADYMRALAAGAVAVTQPDAKPWGQSVAYVRDNNGFLVELCTPPIAVTERLARL
jgi:catechol 2,3-dioxygenase-like lactoylglutathione lyase family enzyme